MDSAQRIIVNTIAQQIKSVLNVCLSLYSTRIVLEALGQSDYGIYSLIGGVVAMLSFLTNALVITTQRYFSFYQGKGEKSELLKIFSNSIFIHILLSVVIAALFTILQPVVINRMLVIPDERIQAAAVTYVSVVAMLVLTFFTAPFRALFVARENIVYISVVDVIDGILKLGIAIFLTQCDNDKLITYVFLIPLVSAFNLLALGAGAFISYDECHIPKWTEIDFGYLKKLSGFAGWTVYSTGCIMGRSQGISILLNRWLCNTVINSAYGIALQITGAVQFVAQSVVNATSPQIIKAEGASQHEYMLQMAARSSKFSTLMLAIVNIPLILEMPLVLQLWLKDVPEHTVMFCRFILAAALCDQLTMGLGQANQAIGRIRNYSLIINSVKLVTIPAALTCLHFGFPVVSVMWCYVLFELLCAFLRLPYLKFTAGLSISQFSKSVFLPLIPSLAILALFDLLFVTYIAEFPLRFLATGILGTILLLGTSWKYTLDSSEKNTVKRILHSILIRKMNK